MTRRQRNVLTEGTLTLQNGHCPQRLAADEQRQLQQRPGQNLCLTDFYIWRQTVAGFDCSTRTPGRYAGPAITASTAHQNAPSPAGHARAAQQPPRTRQEHQQRAVDWIGLVHMHHQRLNQVIVDHVLVQAGQVAAYRLAVPLVQPGIVVWIGRRAVEGVGLVVTPAGAQQLRVATAAGEGRGSAMEHVGR